MAVNLKTTTQTFSRRLNPTPVQVPKFNKLKQAGIKSIGLDGQYIKINGINNNTLTFTKEAAAKFIKSIIR